MISFKWLIFKLKKIFCNFLQKVLYLSTSLHIIHEVKRAFKAGASIFYDEFSGPRYK